MTRPRSRSLSRFLPAFVTTLLAGVSLSGPPPPAHAQTWAESDGAASLAITSALDRQVRLPGFGNIAYRAPLVGKRGPVVVLVHGIFAGSTHRSFNELLPLLDAADARVYAGPARAPASESPKRAYSMAVLDQFVETFLDQVVREPATLVAESLLTGSALQVAALRPDRVKSLVLLSPTGAVNLASPQPRRDEPVRHGLWQRLSGPAVLQHAAQRSLAALFLGAHVCRSQLGDRHAARRISPGPQPAEPALDLVFFRRWAATSPLCGCGSGGRGTGAGAVWQTGRVARSGGAGRCRRRLFRHPSRLHLSRIDRAG